MITNLTPEVIEQLLERHTKIYTRRNRKYQELSYSFLITDEYNRLSQTVAGDSFTTQLSNTLQFWKLEAQNASLDWNQSVSRAAPLPKALKLSSFILCLLNHIWFPWLVPLPLFWKPEMAGGVFPKLYHCDTGLSLP